MSSAKKCDICGRLYEIYDARGDDESRPNGMRFVTFGHHGVVKNWPAKDCCPSCMDYIISTVSKLKKRGEETIND